MSPTLLGPSSIMLLLLDTPPPIGSLYPQKNNWACPWVPKAATCPFSPDLQPPGAGQSGVRPPAQAPGGDTLAVLNGALFLGHHQAGRGSQFFPWTPTWKPLPPRPGNRLKPGDGVLAAGERGHCSRPATRLPCPLVLSGRSFLEALGRGGKKGGSPQRSQGLRGWDPHRP